VLALYYGVNLISIVEKYNKINTIGFVIWTFRFLKNRKGLHSSQFQKRGLDG